jgi:hypothetical protein
MSNDLESALIAEQLKHTIDLLRAEIASLKAEQDHIRELSNHRLAQLETYNQDHESRIRSLQDGVTQFKVWSGLASGGSSVMAIIAFIRAFLGGG